MPLRYPFRLSICVNLPFPSKVWTRMPRICSMVPTGNKPLGKLGRTEDAGAEPITVTPKEPFRVSLLQAASATGCCAYKPAVDRMSAPTQEIAIRFIGILLFQIGEW